MIKQIINEVVLEKVIEKIQSLIDRDFVRKKLQVKIHGYEHIYYTITSASVQYWYSNFLRVYVDIEIDGELTKLNVVNPDDESPDLWIEVLLNKYHEYQEGWTLTVDSRTLQMAKKDITNRIDRICQYFNMNGTIKTLSFSMN